MNATAAVTGVRCTECGYRATGDRPRCPSCHGRVEPCAFKPDGKVWSWTTVRIPVPGWEPPYRVAYVDLNAGPRVLVHLPVDSNLRVGATVRIDRVDPNDIYLGHVVEAAV